MNSLPFFLPSSKNLWCMGLDTLQSEGGLRKEPFVFIWWTGTMRAQGGLILLLLLLAVLCSTGVSLKCYSCLDPVISSCKTNTTCSPNLDSCLIAVSGKLVYQQCWKFSDCDAKFIMSRLEMTNVKYRCCQKDLCNDEYKEVSNPNNEATCLLGKTALLGTSVLAAILKLCF